MLCRKLLFAGLDSVGWCSNPFCSCCLAISLRAVGFRCSRVDRS